MHITASYLSHTKHSVSQNNPDMAQIALAAPLPAPDSHGITDYLLPNSSETKFIDRRWFAE